MKASERPSLDRAFCFRHIEIFPVARSVAVIGASPLAGG
jgi:hypothetical protein